MAAHEIKFEPGFVFNVDKHPAAIYSDTDSMYLKLTVDKIFDNKFNKYDKIYWADAIKLALDISKDINDSILHLMSAGQIGTRANFDPEFQRFYFKTEVVALRMLLFNVKKTYALTYIYDEGVYLEKPSIKKTGGLVSKSNVSKISKNIFEEIYEVLLTKNFETITEVETYIFKDLLAKYTKLFKKAVDNWDWEIIGFPNKYGFGTKTITKWVWGARFFNTFFANKLRPGDSLYSVYITYNEHKLRDILPATSDIHTLNKSIVESKYDMFSIAIEDHEDFIKIYRDKIRELEEKIDFKISYDKNYDNQVLKKFDAFKIFF